MNGMYVNEKKSEEKFFNITLVIEGEFFQGNFLDFYITEYRPEKIDIFIPIPKKEAESLKGIHFKSQEVISVIKKYAPEFWL